MNQYNESTWLIKQTTIPSYHPLMNPSCEPKMNPSDESENCWTNIPSNESRAGDKHIAVQRIPWSRQPLRSVRRRRSSPQLAKQHQSWQLFAGLAVRRLPCMLGLRSRPKSIRWRYGCCCSASPCAGGAGYPFQIFLTTPLLPSRDSLNSKFRYKLGSLIALIDWDSTSYRANCLAWWSHMRALWLFLLLCILWDWTVMRWWDPFHSPARELN